MMRHLFLLCGLIILVSCTTPAVEPTSTPIPQPTTEPTTTTAAVEPTLSPPTATPLPLAFRQGKAQWWNGRVFYEIFVRSFYDSDGDGVGDLPGLISKLDYLNDGNPETNTDLGITGIWLMPIHVSPSYHGYDVTDYYQVDPEYGTNEDMLKLVEEAHKRGIAIIIDLVLNHTSTQHPWFIESAAAADSPYRDYYLWSDTNPGYPGPFDGPAWHSKNGAFYYGAFWSEMPDLNLLNPAVTEEIHNFTRFWLEEMGVDGFRLDAIKHFVEEGQLQENTDSTHAWLQEYYLFYKSVDPDALTVGEAWTTSDEVAEYIENKEVDLAFDFELADGMIESALTGRKVHIERAQTTASTVYPLNQFATFLANHDQERVGSRLFNDEQAKVSASLQLLFGGVPFIYYGEEIGQQGKKPDENIRRPLQWSSAGGFTTGTPWNDYFDDLATRNLELYQNDPNSLWHHYQKLIALRQQHGVLQTGDWHLVTTNNDNVYAFLRFTPANTLLIVVNLSKKEFTPADYHLTIEALPFPVTSATELFAGAEVTPPTLNETGGFTEYSPAGLPPYATLVIELK